MASSTPQTRSHEYAYIEALEPAGRVIADRPWRFVPLRDFEIGRPGAQLIDPGTDEQPLLAVLFTRSDSELDRLRAGEAMD